MFGLLFHRRRDREQSLFGNTDSRSNRHDFGPTGGECAGFVEEQVGQCRGGLERLARFEQDTEFGRATGSRDEGGRCRQPQGAGAGDDQHTHGAGNRTRPAEVFRGEPQPSEKRGDGNCQHRRDEPGRDRIGQRGHGCPAALSFPHEPGNVGQTCGLADRLHPKPKGPGLIECAARDEIANPLDDGPGLAREHRFIDGRFALGHPAIHGDTLARAHEEQVVDQHLLDRDGLNLGLSRGSRRGHEVGDCRTQRQEARQGGCRSDPGSHFQPAPHKDECHDHRGAFVVDRKVSTAKIGGKRVRKHGRGQTETERREHSYRDQDVHVGRATPNGDVRPATDRPPAPEHDEERHARQRQVPHQAVRDRHAQDHDHAGERNRHAHSQEGAVDFVVALRCIARRLC